MTDKNKKIEDLIFVKQVKILRVIDSCTTERQLMNTYNWINDVFKDPKVKNIDRCLYAIYEKGCRDTLASLCIFKMYNMCDGEFSDEAKSFIKKHSKK